MASDIVQRAIEEAGVRVGGRRHAAALGGWVMDSAPMRIPPSILSNHIKRELTPILESALANELESIETIANASVMAYKGPMSPRFSTRARRITSSTCRVSF